MSQCEYFSIGDYKDASKELESQEDKKKKDILKKNESSYYSKKEETPSTSIEVGNEDENGKYSSNKPHKIEIVAKVIND